MRSIRLSDALWAALQAQADSLGVSLNRYVALRLEGGVRRDLKSAAHIVYQDKRGMTRPVDARTGEPIPERRPYQKGQKRPAA